MNSTPHYWAVIPAAGIGSRMGAAIPKQYLSIHGQSVIAHTLQRLTTHPQISGVVVVINADDQHWKQLDTSAYHNLYITEGGNERCHSVLNGLNKLAGKANSDDWVLVHDAARPCIHHDDITAMIAALKDHSVGGLLGLPVADTMKRSNPAGDVLETVSRENLWRALTPQMFRLGQLQRALESALEDGFLVTDEASAIEHAGYQPRMVEGRADNIKITRPDDLALAEMYLVNQENQ